MKQIGRACTPLLQNTPVPLVLDTISHRQVRHQVARQKLAWPLLPYLIHEILDSNFQVGVLDARGDFVDAGGLLCNDAVDILRDNLLAGVETCTVLHPLPELHTCDLSSSSILHQVVDRDAAITADPSCTVSKSHRDIGADALLGDRSGDVGAQQVCGSDFHILTSDVILQPTRQ